MSCASRCSSSGAFIVLDLFILQTDVVSCSRRFESLARRIFASRSLTSRSPCARLHKISLSWLADGRHDATILEDILREVYGTTRRLFDVASRFSGVKVAVTATTINDARLCLFPNYFDEECKKQDIAMVEAVSKNLCQLLDKHRLYAKEEDDFEGDDLEGDDSEGDDSEGDDSEGDDSEGDDSGKAILRKIHISKKI